MNNENMGNSNGFEPYYCEDNGFYWATHHGGIAAFLPLHVRRILDNAALEITSTHEQLTKEIESSRDRQAALAAQEITDKEEIGRKNQVLAEKREVLASWEAKHALENQFKQKTQELATKETELVGLEAELGNLPPDQARDSHSKPKHRALPLYLIAGALCCIVALSLYFFYVSALDKAFFQTLGSYSEDMETDSYTGLNEIFNPTAVFKAFQGANFWLVLFSVFPIALAFVIHPIWISAQKCWESENKWGTIGLALGAFAVLAATFVFDSILALQISKKIHESKVLMGLAQGEWSISPTDPFTWNLDIVLVLFCGFFASFLLSLLFHFTMEMWKEARTPVRDLERKVAVLKAEMRTLETEIGNLTREIGEGDVLPPADEDASEKVPTSARIARLKAEIQNLETAVELLENKVRNAQQEIQNLQNEINELLRRLENKVVDRAKLDSQVAQFLAGWGKFIAAKGLPGSEAENAQRIASDTLNRYFENLKDNPPRS